MVGLHGTWGSEQVSEHDTEDSVTWGLANLGQNSMLSEKHVTHTLGSDPVKPWLCTMDMPV